MNTEDTIATAIRITQALTTETSTLPPTGGGSIMRRHIGENLIVRTVTMTLTGRLIDVDDHDLLLADAAWIADSGRWADALANGTLSEVEPFPAAAGVGRGAIVDWAVWPHDLPRAQK